MKILKQAVPVVLFAAAAAAFLAMGPAPRAFAQGKAGGKGGFGGGGGGKGGPGGGKAAPAPPQKPPVVQIKDAKIGVLKVQGNVYMMVTPDGNVAVSVGDWGVLVVDTPPPGYGEAVMNEIRKLSDKPIRYIINTSIDRTGSNDYLSRAGAPVTGGNLGAAALANGATVIAHENVQLRMADVPEGQAVPDPDLLPTTTFDDGQKEVFFNEEPVIAKWFPMAHTDGDSIVTFRRSDVVAAGEIFDMTSYPHIDLAKGGGIEGELKGLNFILDFCVPRHEQEGGTYVIPGHGRLTDEHDVLEYRDMVTIIRDRIKAGIGKGQNLAQIKAAKPTYEYDARWGSTKGEWTTDRFIEAVYKSLGGK